MDISLLLFLLLGLLCLSGFLSGSETALFSLSPLTLKSYRLSKEKRFLTVAQLMERPREVLVTLMMGNILANLLVQNTVSSLFAPFADWSLKVGLPLALTLIFGEVLPKSIALPKNTALAPRVAPIILWMSRIVRPIREPLTKATGWISRALFGFLSKERDISPEELRHVLKSSRSSGVLLPQECDLVGGSLDLQHSLVKERMRPREEVLYYDIRDPLERLTHLLVDLETTRVPVCDGDLEQLLSILSIQQYFFHKGAVRKGEDLRPLLKKPYFVPESTRAWTLFMNMRERGEDLAMVVDEYGSIAGLITQEDLIEAVVGEISDLRDVKSLYTRSSEDVIIASGKMELEAFNDLFSTSLASEENIVTLGGWLTEQLGDIPLTGTKYVTDQFLFYVLNAEPTRIRRIYVRRLVPPRSK